MTRMRADIYVSLHLPNPNRGTLDGTSYRLVKRAEKARI